MSEQANADVMSINDREQRPLSFHHKRLLDLSIQSYNGLQYNLVDISVVCVSQHISLLCLKNAGWVLTT